jgi:uncharacterized protein
MKSARSGKQSQWWRGVGRRACRFSPGFSFLQVLLRSFQAPGPYPRGRFGSCHGDTRLSARGFDVVAYDSRAHGDSGGEICTYGFYEKRDLHRVIDVLESGPVIVMGSSLGGAVALQAAAEDARISAVIAAESFSDLRTVAAERAPWFFTATTVRQALALAETEGRFDAVSPRDAARRISVPVLLIHGAVDHKTPPEHSRRIFESLNGRKRLLLVEDAGHNQSLHSSSVWSEIESWIESVLESDR